ncbi:very short patch repair endonuclease [Paraburkholderia sp. RL17-368-BIF-A]|uniref:very short patch repair endonuclease n=1 Tax=Paraburkholderia sp. RL17-368-BIF-A TaxID=3031628 RepID=UPI0038C9AC03
MDNLTPEQRRKTMQRVRAADTAPELRVRRLLFGLGYRYRLHVKDLPGRPDIVFRGRRKVIFVHGCFWHRHAGCKDASMPASKLAYWRPKFERTVARDADAIAKLAGDGWKVLVIWTCEMRDETALGSRLQSFLDER